MNFIGFKYFRSIICELALGDVTTISVLDTETETVISLLNMWISYKTKRFRINHCEVFINDFVWLSATETHQKCHVGRLLGVLTRTGCLPGRNDSTYIAYSIPAKERVNDVNGFLHIKYVTATDSQESLMIVPIYVFLRKLNILRAKNNEYMVSI